MFTKPAAYVFTRPGAYLVAFALAAGLAAAHAPAALGWDEDATSVSVPYTDLDLKSPEGFRVLVTRITNAARQACGPAPSDRVDFALQYDACVKRVVDNATRDLPVTVASSNGSPALDHR